MTLPPKSITASDMAKRSHDSRRKKLGEKAYKEWLREIGQKAIKAKKDKAVDKLAESDKNGLN